METVDIEMTANNFLEPYSVNAVGSATRSTSQVGVGSLHGR
jgi:hypothetical protein